jgi:hypothetical protein
MRSMMKLVLMASCMVPLVAHADSGQVLSPVRAVVMRPVPTPPFQGVGLGNFHRLAILQQDEGTADEFRDDAVMIWSSAAGTPWRVLPPQRKDRSGGVPVDGLPAEAGTAPDEPQLPDSAQ